MAELKWWLINAFNGEWLRVEHAVPKAQMDGRSVVR
jgi:dipeptidyl aminopeptidase